MKKILSTTFILISSVAVFAQSGGVYEITQSVTGSGGGNASGGSFSLDGTAGQSVADNSAQTPFVVRSGFWQSFAPATAANVSISGRVRTSDGRGLSNAVVSLTDARGNSVSVRTGSFGAYRFDGIEAGQTVIVMVISRRFQFQPQIVTVNESLTDVDFVPIGENFKRIE